MHSSSKNWKELLSQLDTTSFHPRTLDIKMPYNLANENPTFGTFLQIAYDKNEFSILDFTNSDWTKDKIAHTYYWGLPPTRRMELLACLTSFIHEISHKFDFLTNPFGLNFYAQTLREYHKFQKFFPQILDNERTVTKLRYLISFEEELHEDDRDYNTLKKYWANLTQITQYFYSIGDAGTEPVLGKFIKEGWGGKASELNIFGDGTTVKLVTVLDSFQTFQPIEEPGLWYVRPATILEAKAVTNSLLFILNLFGEDGIDECRYYYETVCTDRSDKKKLGKDYLFLLDFISKIYDFKDFSQVLRAKKFDLVKSILVTISSICWYALQAPPAMIGDTFGISNPVFRLLSVTAFFRAYIKGRTKKRFESTSALMDYMDNFALKNQPVIKPINEIIPNCVKITDYMIELNEKETWNPSVRSHFDHIFKLMRPHFSNRKLSYQSFTGMPESGNSLDGCKRDFEHEILTTDYKCPKEAKEWFDIRSNFLFKLNRPTKSLITRLDNHFMAFYCPYICECGNGITGQWLSRHSSQHTLYCDYCDRKKIVDKENISILNMLKDSSYPVRR